MNALRRLRVRGRVAGGIIGARGRQGTGPEREKMTEEFANIVEVKSLWRIYKVGTLEVAALRGIDLTIPTGKFMALKGRSGSGKTTLLNCLGGLDKPNKGSIFVSGHNLAEMTDRQLTDWRRDKVGFVFQSFGLLPTMSAYENVELMLRLSGAHARQRHERTIETLKLVGFKNG